MKAMVISDIHGDVKHLENAIERYKEEKASKLFILGDFAGYFSSINDEEVANMLLPYAKEISAVRGNCDNEHIEQILPFGLLDIRHINLNGKIVTITHGHLYNKYNLPEYCGDIFLSGHTHYGIISKEHNKIFANPGSISKPRNGSEHTYLLIDETNIYLKNLEGQIIEQEDI